MPWTFSQRLAGAALGGVCCFAITAVLMHAIQPDVNPIDDAVSYYMNGRFGWLLGAGLVALGGGSLALLWAIRVCGGARSRAGSWCLAIWGTGAAIGGIFPPDPRGHWHEPPSVSGMIHSGVAIPAFLAFPVAALLLAAEVSGSPPRKRWLLGFAIASLASLLIFMACLAPVFSHHAPHYLGLAERVLLATYSAWLITASASFGPFSLK